VRFTLVTPVMNGMPWLPACVASIDAQRADVELEHIVLDPGSTDGTRAWLESNARAATLVFESDRGQVDALQKGFARATGDVLGWLNADDVLAPGALARVARAFADHPDAQIVTGTCALVDEDGAPAGSIVPPRDPDLATLLRTVTGLPQPATFFRKRAFDGFDARYRLIFDNDFYRRVARRSPTAVVTVAGAPLATFRIRAASISGSAPAEAALEDLRSRLEHGLSPLSFAAAALATRAWVYPRLPERALDVARRAKRAVLVRRDRRA
jgi:glycosyltransferase involved in cell wall biosynthesis